MTENLEKQDRATLQEEFKRAKINREIKRGLEKSGLDLDLDIIKAVMDEYQRVASGQRLPENEQREIVVDGDMVRSGTLDKDDVV